MPVLEARNASSDGTDTRHQTGFMIDLAATMLLTGYSGWSS
jgi:hypothetical protein